MLHQLHSLHIHLLNSALSLGGSIYMQDCGVPVGVTWKNKSIRTLQLVCLYGQGLSLIGIKKAGT